MLWPKVWIRPGVDVEVGAVGAAVLEVSAGVPEASPGTVSLPESEAASSSDSTGRGTASVGVE